MQMAFPGMRRLHKSCGELINRFCNFAAHRQRDPLVEIAIPLIFHVAERELTEGEAPLISVTVSLRVGIRDEVQAEMPAHTRMNWEFVFWKRSHQHLAFEASDCIISGVHCREKLGCQF